MIRRYNIMNSMGFIPVWVCNDYKSMPSLYKSIAHTKQSLNGSNLIQNGNPYPLVYIPVLISFVSPFWAY
jgi:hypothetical protein